MGKAAHAIREGVEEVEEILGHRFKEGKGRGEGG
jgi:hypothetical protein